MDSAFIFGIFDSIARFFTDLFKGSVKDKKKKVTKKGTRKGVKKKA